MFPLKQKVGAKMSYIPSNVPLKRSIVQKWVIFHPKIPLKEAKCKNGLYLTQCSP